MTTERGAVLMRPARLSHVKAFAAAMRQADRDEILASDGLGPAQMLRKSLRASFVARSVFVGDEPLAMWGMALLRPGIAMPWGLTTTAVERFPLAFWRTSKLVVGWMRQKYPVLVQCIDARHERAVHWAQRLGFTVDGPHPLGVQQLPFYRITLVSKAEG